MTDHDLTTELAERVRDAAARRTPLRIVGGDTKRFLGREVSGDALAMARHAGIVNYDPAELVVTARAGTPLRDVEALLGSHGQCLPFDPPRFGDGATLGGTVACGLADPGRGSSGPLRDYVLGVRILCGDGRVLRFMLKAGQSIREHNAPDSPFYVVVLQGHGLFSGGDGQELRVGPHDLLIFAPGENHEIKAQDEDLVFVGFLQGVPGTRPYRIGGELGRG